MAEKSSSPTATSDRELVTTRVFDAPRELVYEVWTRPEHVAQWYGPNGFSITTQEMDVRPGGVWRFVMHGPDGVDYPNENIYTEVVRPERLAYTHTQPKFSVNVTFKDQGGKTEVTQRMVFETAAEYDNVVAKYGAVEGAKQTFNRLEVFLAGMSPETDLFLTRDFDAPIDMVFEAWTNPLHMAQWWGPRGFTNPVCEVDARPGGSIRIDMRGPDGTIYPMLGEYREIIRPERIVFMAGALDSQGNLLFETLNTVTFVAHGDKTTLTVRASVSNAKAGAASHLKGANVGWTESLECLANYLANNERIRS